MNDTATPPEPEALPPVAGSEEPETWSYPSSQHCIPLWPCPMCGAEPNFTEHKIAMVWTAECPECGLTLGMPYGYGSRLDLCRDWNRRSPLPQNIQPTGR